MLCKSLNRNFFMTILFFCILLISFPSYGFAKEYSEKEIVEAIISSDDIRQHKEGFILATKKLLKNGYSYESIRNYGGWIRSQNFKPYIVYFLNPGSSNADKWYTFGNGNIYKEQEVKKLIAQKQREETQRELQPAINKIRKEEKELLKELGY